MASRENEFVELQDYWAILRKRWLSITVFAVLGAALGVAVSLATTPLYDATTQLYVSVKSGDSSSGLLQGSNFTRQQVTSYTQLVTSPLVLQPVIDDLGL